MPDDEPERQAMLKAYGMVEAGDKGLKGASPVQSKLWLEPQRLYVAAVPQPG